jgi:hypothetical protein
MESRMKLISRKYRLKDGSIYWHKLYFALMPEWTTRYSPPLGDYNYASYLYRPHKYVMDLYDHAKWFVQRGYRGYADCDVWGIDWYLTKWLSKAIRQLKNSKLGHPMGMTPKGWQTRLEKMAVGFDAAHRLEDNVYDWRSKEARLLRRQFNVGMKLFHKHFFSLWD